MKVYRILNEGEILQDGDEWLEVYNGDEVWHPVRGSIGDALLLGPGDTFRRPITRVTEELTHLRADLATARAEYAAALDTLRDATAELDTRRENLELCQKRLITTETERNTYRAALEEIHINYGKVCTEFEVCEHPACASSYGAWAVADEALRGVVPSEFINQYTPWDTEGLTELQYYHRAFLSERAENARLTAEVEAASAYIFDLSHPLNAVLPQTTYSREKYFQLYQARAARVQAAAPGTGEA